MIQTLGRKKWIPQELLPRVEIVSVCVLVSQLCLTLCDPMDCSPPVSFVHGDSSGKNTGVVSHSLL